MTIYAVHATLLADAMYLVNIMQDTLSVPWLANQRLWRDTLNTHYLLLPGCVSLSVHHSQYMWSIAMPLNIIKPQAEQHTQYLVCETKPIKEDFMLW